jgi:biotin operon repressor
MDPIKEAFQKIKEEIFLLKNQLSEISLKLSEQSVEISEMKTKINDQSAEIDSLNLQLITQESLCFQSESINAQNANSPADMPIPARLATQQTNQQTNQQTQNNAFKTLKGENLDFSIGNRGVPTNRQTNQQTNQPIDQQSPNLPKEAHISQNKDINTANLEDFKKASEMLSSLDSIKKEIRLKFKRLTTQEMVVFSTIYSLQETISDITYRTIALHLNLSESSIRDYINKLIKKGIPINKNKQNNKTITLNISQDLKKIASLATILQLRDM